MDHRRRWCRVDHWRRRLNQGWSVHRWFRCAGNHWRRLRRRWRRRDRRLRRRHDMLRLYCTRCHRYWVVLRDDGLDRRRLRGGDRRLRAVRDRARCRYRCGMLNGGRNDMSRCGWRAEHRRFGARRRMDLRNDGLSRRRRLRASDRWLGTVRNRTRGWDRSGMFDCGGADMPRGRRRAQHRRSGRWLTDRGSCGNRVLCRRVQGGRHLTCRRWHGANCWPGRHRTRGGCRCRQVEPPCDSRGHADGHGGRLRRLRPDQRPCVSKLCGVHTLGKTAHRA